MSATTPEDEELSSEELLKLFLDKYKDEAVLQKFLRGKDERDLRQLKKGLEILIEVPESPKSPRSPKSPKKKPIPKIDIDKAKFEKAIKLLERQTIRSKLKKPISEAMVDYILEYYDSGVNVEAFQIKDKTEKAPLIRIIDSGNTELFQELFGLQKESWSYGREWLLGSNKEYFIDEFFKPTIQSLLKSDKREMIKEFLKFCFEFDKKHGSDKTPYITILANELYFNVPDKDKDLIGYQRHMENRALFEEYMLKSEITVDDIDELFKKMISSHQLELAEKLKYYSNFKDSNEVLRAIKVLVIGIKNTQKPEDKKILYDLIINTIKEGLRQGVDKRYKNKDYDEDPVLFFQLLSATGIFSMTLQDGRKDLTAYLIEIFGNCAAEQGKTLYPFNARDLMVAERTKDPAYLELIEKSIGRDPIDKVKFLLDSLPILQCKEQDFLDVFALPLPWTKKDESQFFTIIDKSKFVTDEEKYYLKKTFEKTRDIRDLSKKKEVEKIYRDFKSQQILLDTRLFGTIQNDPNFQGTNIQGSTMNLSIRYLNDLIDRIQGGAINIPGLKPEEQKAYAENLLSLKSKLTTAMSVYDRINYFIAMQASLYSDTETDEKKKKETLEKREAAIKKMNEDIQVLILNELKSTGSVLIPGGWTGLNEMPGHAMLYEFKIEDGNLLFLVHNMGDGIDYHAQKRLQDKTYYSSVRAFKCPFSGKIDEDLPKLVTPMITSLLKPRYLPITTQEAQGSRAVYSRIKKVVLDSGMQEVDPFNYSKEWVVGQFSGTCAFRVFESFLSSYPFKAPLKYDDVHYEIMRSSLQEFFDRNKKDGNLRDETIQRQLNFALQNLSILLQDLASKVPPALSDERIDSW